MDDADDQAPLDWRDHERMKRAIAGVVAGGDPTAFCEALYTLARLLLRRLNPRAAMHEAVADDLVQSAVVWAWGRVGEYDADLSRPSTFFSTVMRRKMLDALIRSDRRRKRERAVHLDDIGGGEIEDDLRLIYLCAQRDVARGPSPEQREALRNMYGRLTAQEAADRLGVSVNRVRLVWYRGMTQAQRAEARSYFERAVALRHGECASVVANSLGTTSWQVVRIWTSARRRGLLQSPETSPPDTAA